MKWQSILSFFQKGHIFPIKEKTPSQNGEEMYDYSSLDIIYDLVFNHFTRQQDRLNALDAKASFVLSSSTAVIGVGLALQSSVLQHSYSVCAAYIPEILRTLPVIVKRVLPITPLIVSYFIAVIISYNAYKVRPFHREVDGRELKPFLEKPESFTKAMLLNTIIDVSNQNKMMLDQKAVLLERAFKMLVAESFILILFLVLNVVC